MGEVVITRAQKHPAMSQTKPLPRLLRPHLVLCYCMKFYSLLAYIWTMSALIVVLLPQAFFGIFKQCF